MLVHGVQAVVGARQCRENRLFEHIVVRQDPFRLFQQLFRAGDALLFVHRLHLRDDFVHLHIVVEPEFLDFLLHLAFVRLRSYRLLLRKRCAARHFEEEQQSDAGCCRKSTKAV